jgi:hypothetical protein
MAIATSRAQSTRLSLSTSSLLCDHYSIDSFGSPNVVCVAVISIDASTPTTMPNMCPASFTCPENKGCTYTGGSRTLTLACGADFYRRDFTIQYAAGLEACTQACADNAQCAAASFVGGKCDGRCYLKNTRNGGSANDGADGESQS